MDEEELMDMLITERMSWHIKKFREQYPNEGRDALGRSEAVKKYEAATASMSPDELSRMNECVDDLTELIFGDNERFYRAGIEDGICIDKLIKQIKERQN